MFRPQNSFKSYLYGLRKLRYTFVADDPRFTIHITKDGVSQVLSELTSESPVGLGAFLKVHLDCFSVWAKGHSRLRGKAARAEASVANRPTDDLRTDAIRDAR